jgi:hypothetical protein
MESNHAQYESLLKQKLTQFKAIIPLTTENAWKSSGEQQGVKIHKKKDKDSGLYMVRAEGVIKHPKGEVQKLLRDGNAILEWDKTIETFKSLDEWDVTYSIGYTCIKKPAFIIDRRDFNFLSTDYTEEDGTIWFVGTSIDYEKMPPQKNCVRCDIPLWGWKLEDDKQSGGTFASYAVLCDPRGNIPKLIANAVCEEQALNLVEIGKYLEKQNKEKKLIGSNQGKVNEQKK